MYYKKETLDKLTGVLLIVAATVLWGSSFAVRKMAMADIGPLMFNTVRFLAAFIFMLTIFLIHRKHEAREYEGDISVDIKSQIKKGIIIGMLYAVGSVFQQMGLNLVTAGETGFITSLYTVMVPLLARFIFKVKLRPVIWFAVAFSGVGLYFVTDGGVSVNSGTFMLMAGSFCFALQIIAISKFVQGNDPLLLVTVQLGIGVAVNLLMAVIAGEPFELIMISKAIIPIIYTGVMSLGVANFCQFAGQRKVTPTVAAIVCSFESVFGLLFGILLLNETMTIMKLAGCVFILIAVIMSQIKGKEK